MYEMKYTTNVIENIIITAILNVSDELQGKCIMDISKNSHWVDFYLCYLKPTLLTCIGSMDPLSSLLSSKYSSNDIVDVLDLKTYDRIGIFEEQYDLVTDFMPFFLRIEDDRLWQRYIENMCFYLKPGGLFIVTGDFTRTYTSEYYGKLRSEGIWKAIVGNCNCSVVNVIDNYIKGLTNEVSNIMVIKKNE